MASHRAHPVYDVAQVRDMGLSKVDPTGAILYDDCPRCAEHADELLNFDNVNMRRLWDRMVQVEREDGSYRTLNEMKACKKAYYLAVWLERNLGIDPWTSLVGLRCQLGIHWPPGITTVGGSCVECGAAVPHPAPITG